MEIVRGEIPGRLFCVYPRKYVKIHPLFPFKPFLLRHPYRRVLESLLLFYPV